MSDKKSDSQRLRAVLFLLFQKDPKGFEFFEDYYANQMDKIISHFKNKL